MKINLPLETRLAGQVLVGFVGAPICFVIVVVESSEQQRDTNVAVAGLGALLSVFVGLAWWYFHHHGREDSLPGASNAGSVAAIAAGLALLITPGLSDTGFLWTCMFALFFSITTVVTATLRTKDLRTRHGQ